MLQKKSATDILEQVETIVGKMRSKDFSEENINARVRNFLKKNIQKLVQEWVSFIVGNPVDIKKSRSAHTAQEILMEYLPSYNGHSNESQSQENHIPLKVAWFKIGSMHSESVSWSIIEKYVDKIMGIYSDLALHEAETKNELTYYDTLTGISNRLGLIKNATQMCHDNELVSVIWLDIDDFKPFNTFFGHLGGDKALQFFARRLSEFMEHKFWKRSEATWKYPFFGRYWWEEFLIVLPWIAWEEATKIAQELVEWMRIEKITLTRLFEMDEKTWKPEKILGHVDPEKKSILISAWVATYDPNTFNKAELDKYIADNKSWWIAFQPFLWLTNHHADDALSKSKFRGKNCATYYLDEGDTLPKE